MKRTLATFVVAALLVVLATASAFAAVGNIAITKHNLSATSTATGAKAATGGEDEICVFCHTPHRAAPAVPLWNRSAPATASYKTYGDISAPSTTLDGTRDTLTNASTNISVLCLSCHDGSISLGAITENYGADSVVITMTGTSVDATTGKLLSSVHTNLGGADLTNDHPIAIEYKETADMKAISSLTNVVLFGTTPKKVECASCHSVHSNTNAPFLRRSNAGSALCLECHNK